MPKKEAVVEERVEVKFTLSKEAYAEFQELKALLSGKFPKGATPGEIFEAALTISVNKLSPKRKAERKNSEQNQLSAKKVLKPNSRYIPSSVKQAVYVRDNGCCTFVGSDGKRCESNHRLQYHHHEAHARGGANTETNVSLMCATHNILLAEKDFGRAHMQKFVLPR